MKAYIIYLNLLESFYIYYVYNLYKTRISFHHPLEIFFNENLNISEFFKHPINSGVYENKICTFGKLSSKLIILWLWLRFMISKNKMLRINKYLFILIFTLSFIMNINSFIYFIPIYIYEFFIFPRIY
ncbi:unnamed protein product [marine sediment metagenome]|uniref:Uncharacterized protein n=1 Tax=marine sediment metagenome TaxID=412755 RepID=X0YG94_9ZZZZ